MKQTIEYYNKNAEEYYNNTININMDEQINKFLAYIPSPSKILDFGCGSGRDSQKFLKMGYAVTMLDGSYKLAEKASKYTNHQVIVENFLDYRDESEYGTYNGIWACSTLFHLNNKELLKVLCELSKSLRYNGCLYASFKDKENPIINKDRYFNDMNIEKMQHFLKKIGNLSLIDDYYSEPITSCHTDEPWHNYYIRKIRD